jgi:septum formation protein
VVILASASPRRRALLARLVPEFTVRPSDVPEDLEPGPLRQALARLALAKARAVVMHAPGAIVLAADTVVVIDGDVLGKPGDAAEARAMLRRLRGREHEVLTAVAVVDAGTGRAETTVVASRVVMRAYGDDVIDAYVGSGEPLDKAGAYAIQGLGGALVAALAGSRSNVVGLPLDETRRLLEAFGVPLRPCHQCGGAAGIPSHPLSPTSESGSPA